MTEKIRIDIESFFNNKAFIQANNALTQITRNSKSFNAEWSKIMNTQVGVGLFDDIRNMASDATKQKDVEKYLNRFGLNLRNLAKNAQENSPKFRKMWDDMTSGQEKFNTASKRTAKTGGKNTLAQQYTRDYNEIMKSNNMLRDNTQGTFTSIGQFTKKAVKNAKKMRSDFSMEFLGTMFFGMALQRTFQGLAKSSVSSFMKISEGMTPAGQAVNALYANFELLKFSIGSALGGILQALLPSIIPIIEGLTEWINKHEKLAGWFIILMIAIGGALFWFSQLWLGIQAIVNVFKTLSAIKWAKLGAAMTSPFGLTVIAVLLAIAALVSLGIYFDNLAKSTAPETYQKVTTAALSAIKQAFTDLATSIMDPIAQMLTLSDSTKQTTTAAEQQVIAWLWLKSVLAMTAVSVAILLNSFVAIIRSLWNLMEMIGNLGQMLGDIQKGDWSSLKKDWQDLKNDGQDTYDAWQNVADMVQNVADSDLSKNTFYPQTIADELQKEKLSKAPGLDQKTFEGIFPFASAMMKTGNDNLDAANTKMKTFGQTINTIPSTNPVITQANTMIDILPKVNEEIKKTQDAMLSSVFGTNSTMSTPTIDTTDIVPTQTNTTQNLPSFFDPAQIKVAQTELIKLGEQVNSIASAPLNLNMPNSIFDPTVTSNTMTGLNTVKASIDSVNTSLGGGGEGGATGFVGNVQTLDEKFGILNQTVASALTPTLSRLVSALSTDKSATLAAAAAHERYNRALRGSTGG